MDLSEYIFSKDRRLIASVGGGDRDLFEKSMYSSNPDIPEYIRFAKWMKFQEKKFGYDILSMTIPTEKSCRYIKKNWKIHKKTDVKSEFISYIDSILEFKKTSSNFVGGGSFGPFTLSGEVMDIKKICVDCIKNPDNVHYIMNEITEFLCELAREFERNGADFIWIAEPTGVMVSPKHFREYVKPYLKKIYRSVNIPGFLHIPGNTNHILDGMIYSGAQGLSLDSMINFRNLAYKLPENMVIRGNINSIALLQEDSFKVAEKVNELNQSIRNFPQFIIGSGGGIIKNTSEINIETIKKETVKHKWYGKNEYEKINKSWKMFATENSTKIFTALSKKTMKEEVLLNALDEAFNYTKYRYENSTMAYPEYKSRIDLIKDIYIRLNIECSL